MCFVSRCFFFFALPQMLLFRVATYYHTQLYKIDMAQTAAPCPMLSRKYMPQVFSYLLFAHGRLVALDTPSPATSSHCNLYSSV